MKELLDIQHTSQTTPGPIVKLPRLPHCAIPIRCHPQIDPWAAGQLVQPLAGCNYQRKRPPILVNPGPRMRLHVPKRSGDLALSEACRSPQRQAQWQV